MIWKILVGLLAGFCASIGVGGGSLIIIYLTLFLHYEQLRSQGINLAFFVACSLVALCFHFKNKLVDYHKAFSMLLFGIIGVFGGYWLGLYINQDYIAKAFAVLLVVLAFAQLKSAMTDIKKRKKDREQNSRSFNH